MNMIFIQHYKFHKSSSVLVNNDNNILVLGEDLGQRLDDTALTAEKKYSSNFTEYNKKFCLSFYYNGANSYLFVNGVKGIKFKANNSEINAIPLCLKNISKDFSVDNVKKTGLNGYVYDFMLIMTLLLLMIY